MSEYWQRVQNIRSDTEQRIAFDQDVSRVVIAGPGSGKTYLLTTKVAKLLHTGTVKVPHRIACLTYSNFLEKQLREDLQALEVLDDERIFVGTVHGFCIAEVILPFQKLYQLRVPTPLRIASWEEMLEATKQALNRQYPRFPGEKNALENVTRKLSNYRRLYWDTDRKDFPESPPTISLLYPELNWAQFSKDYSTFLWKEENPSVDFVHLEIEALKTIQSHTLVQQSLAARYSWWIIDEYQDLGQPFHQMMLCLFKNTKIQLLAIGDPDQCIYEELQGSKPKLIFELSKAIQVHGGFNLITLKTNYRSTQEIIDLSEVVLGEKRGYLAKQNQNVKDRIYSISCPDSGQQAMIMRLLHFLVQKKQGPRLQLNQILLLHPHRKGWYGINRISEKLEEATWLNQLDKEPDYNDRRVKLVEWIEKLAQWCAKESFSSRPYFTNLLPAWIELLENHQGFTLVEERFRHEKRLFEILWNLRDKTMNLREWLESLRENLQLDPIIKSYEVIRPDDAKEFFHLCNIVKWGNRLPNWDVARFAKIGNRIQLTTIHSSKGAQYEAVIVAGFDRIGFGERRYHPEDLDKRIAYVGVTRAKKYLFLLHSDSRAHFVSRITTATNEIVEFIEYDGRNLRRLEEKY